MEKPSLFAFENPHYRRGSGVSRPKIVEIKKLYVAFVLSSVTFLTIVSLLIYFLSQNSQQVENDGSSGRDNGISRTAKLIMEQTGVLLFPNSSDNQMTRIENQFLAKSGKVGEKKMKILFWSEFFGWQFSNDRIKQRMNNSICDIIFNNKEYLNTSDAVVFQSNTINYPERPNSDQIWVYNTVKPVTVDISQEIEFNWTATYNLSSNVPMLPLIYTQHEANRSYVASNKNKSEDGVKLLLYYENKEEQVNYKHTVEELERYFDIDIFDNFAEDKQSKNANEKYNSLYKCLQSLQNNYKFYLILDGFPCKDYISHKFFRVLQFDLIPVVWSGPLRSSYEYLMPPINHNITFLHFEDFNTNATLLKAALNNLNENDVEFNKYFEWKAQYQYHNNYKWFDQLCNMVYLNRHIKMKGVKSHDLNQLSCKKLNETSET